MPDGHESIEGLSINVGMNHSSAMLNGTQATIFYVVLVTGTSSEMGHVLL